MPTKNEKTVDRIVSDARRSRQTREHTYRERALKLFPWVCGRCGREFSGKQLNQLTVHHKDHNHDNNPPDGSNWELLCIYCHDNEHDRDKVAEAYESGTPDSAPAKGLGDNPFAGLDQLLKTKADNPEK
ncbi:MAG: YajD family HNH nuclease [Desulfosarcinaceae bacterium]